MSRSSVGQKVPGGHVQTYKQVLEKDWRYIHKVHIYSVKTPIITGGVHKYINMQNRANYVKLGHQKIMHSVQL